jgi:2-polyprenyl-6-hydroxyphenyl methylase/3-demethylubiquinone-9 3-methyltransferase
LSTINYKEIKKFSKLSEEWWNPLGKFRPLHKLNPIRIKYIRQNIIGHFNIANLKKPLNNLSLLDVGCGGGLLSEPMCRLGAKVTGIDAIKKNIDIAKIHAKKNKLKINYVTTSPEKLKIKKKFDVILNMETVEHVSDLNYFIKSCANLLKKNGIIFIATINRTLKSYLFAIAGAEYILKWLPIGTHDWNLFVKPEELIKISMKHNLKSNGVHGMIYNPLLDQWKTSKDNSVNYISSFIKK